MASKRPAGLTLSADPAASVETSHRVARIYALANQKGGVGKTTTAINLAACLAEAGERVLARRPRPAGERDLGARLPRERASTYDLLDGAPLADSSCRRRFANLFLVAVEARAGRRGGRALPRRDAASASSREALARRRPGYAFVFLDCPPSLGPLTVNALAAADRVIVPVQAEYYALEGLSQLLQSVDLIRAGSTRASASAACC